ncbi:MAG: PAS domain-containing protein [Dehalococcoidia bacterium]
MAPLTQSFLRVAGRVSGSTQTRSRRTWGPVAVSYAFAALLVLCALAIKTVPSLGLGREAPGVLLTGAVLGVALAGGWKPAAFAALIATVGLVVFFLPEDQARTSLRSLVFLAAFLVETAIVILLAEFTRRAAANLYDESQRRAALAELAQLALTSRDDRSLWDRATQRAAEDLGADAALILVPRGTDTSLAAAWPDDLAVDDPGSAYHALVAREATGGGTLLAESEPESPAAAWLVAAGFSAAAVATIESSSGTPAVLVALRRDASPFRPGEGAYLEMVVAVLAAARQRREGERALERSEERLRVAQAAANIGTWEWDLTAQRMAWSDGLEVLHGLAPGSFPESAQDYLALIHQEDRARVIEAVGTRGGGRFDLRYRVILPGGDARWLSASGQVFAGADGRPGRIVGVVADLTDQVKVEEAVRLSEQRFRMMANVAPVLIRVAAPNGACAFINERWSAFTGRSAEEQLGEGWLESVHPEDRDSAREALAASVASRGPSEVEYRIRDAEAEYRWVLDRTVPIDTDDRGFVGFVSSCTDITDRRRAEDALRLAADSGEQLASSLDLESTLVSLARLAVPRFADWSVVFLIAESGEIKRASVVHRDPALSAAADRLANLEPLNPAGESVSARVIRTGEPILAKDVVPQLLADAAEGEAHRQVVTELGIRSILAVPLKVHDEVIGAMAFVRGESGRTFHESDLTLALDLSRRASVSVENARLYSNLVERESAFAHANETLTFLLEASARLSQTLDLDEMMASLASLATPPVADWCAILSLDADQKPLVRAASHRDAQWSERVHALQERYPFNPRSDGPIMRALRDGTPAFLPVIEDQLLRAAAVDDEHLALIRELGLSSAVIVPLRGAHGTYGAMHFVMSVSGRTYSEEDFATLKDLAHRAAIAMDNGTLYREAQEREQDLRRANEAKDEFMGMMSHELRTPLTIINGGARVLRARSAELDAEAKESILSDIEGESDRLFRMVENLLALAHLEFGESFEVEPVHATRLTEKVIAAFRTRRPNREVVLDAEPGAETFAAQPVYLEQVIRNLLSNADKYSPQGVPISIQVRRVSEGVGEFRVQDRGVGVDPEEVDLIFERFYRSERTSRLVGGSGVGLALCKRLIEAMSGQIWARPRDGGGLEVGFSLPLYEEAFV